MCFNQKNEYLPLREHGTMIATNAKYMTHGQLAPVHASCTMTQPPRFANYINILSAPCRIIAAYELHRSVRRILRRILWRIFWGIPRRILQRIFLAYPHSGLEEAGMANFPLKPTPGTNPWDKPLAEVLGMAFSRPII